MKILVLKKGFHGFGPMIILLEEGMITNVQFLLHSEPEIKAEYERFCARIRSDPYEEKNAKLFLSPWMEGWKKKYHY